MIKEFIKEIKLMKPEEVYQDCNSAWFNVWIIWMVYIIITEII